MKNHLFLSLLLVTGVTVLTVSYLRYVELQLKADNATNAFNECGRIVERIAEIKSGIPEKLVAPNSFQPAKATLDIFTRNQIGFEGEPFATELPAVAFGEGNLQTVSISIPKAHIKMSEIAQLLEQIDDSDDPLFVSDVVLERSRNSGTDPGEFWRTGFQLFVVKRASK